MHENKFSKKPLKSQRLLKHSQNSQISKPGLNDSLLYISWSSLPTTVDLTLFPKKNSLKAKCFYPLSTIVDLDNVFHTTMDTMKAETHGRGLLLLIPFLSFLPISAPGLK